MNRQATAFVASLVPSAVAVGLLVWYDRPIIAALAGALGIVAHWWLTKGADDDGELADSSYFFGFLLTLVFLVVGLAGLGSATEGTASMTERLGQFLDDLAAGLFLTVIGLGVRQVRTLSGTTRGVDPLAARQIELTAALSELVEAMRTRPEAQVAHELDEARSRARESVDRFDQSVGSAARRLADNIVALETSITESTNAMQRASAHLGDSLSGAMQRMQAEVAEVLTGIQKQRQQSEQSLSLAQNEAAASRAKADEQLRAHTEMWEASLRQAREAIAQTHRVIDDEYRRGVAAFAQTGTAFRELSEATVTRVNALPNPAERLEGLWAGVARLESNLTAAISGAVQELTTLRERADQLGGGLTRLAGSTDEAAAGMTSGGARLGDALHRELQQMNRIIEEYTTLLEKTSRSLGNRK